MFTDYEHYGIIFGKNLLGNYVTWQFHLLDDGTVSVYWGHYFMEDYDAALLDYNNRDQDNKTFMVTITENLRLTVEVEAENQLQAEQIVSDNWQNSEYILDAGNFVGVEITAFEIGVI